MSEIKLATDTVLFIKDFVARYGLSLPAGESVPKKPIRKLLTFFKTIKDVSCKKKLNTLCMR